MPEIDIFGFNGTSKGNDPVSDENKTDLGKGDVGKVDANGNPIDDINAKDNIADTSSTGGAKGKDDKPADNKAEDTDKQGKGSENKEEENATSYAAGTTIDIDDVTYTIDGVGNMVDPQGNIFKKAEEVNDYLKELQESAEEESAEVDVNTIKKSIGIEVLDDNGKPIEFDNTPEGVAAYVNSVIELKKTEFAEAGVNKMLQTYPIVSDVLNYYIANGNSIEGFGEMKDRTGVVIDETNIDQHEAIIRESFKEFNRRGDVEKYIKYLKDSGELLNVAREELKALQDVDTETRKHNAEEAARIAQSQEKELQDYWDGVKSTIDKRVIGGYKIPETTIIERDGKKISVTPQDFFDYIYQVNEVGRSRYEEALLKETPEQRRDDEILRAWLKFVGKGYNSLVEMAIADKEVNKLKFTSKARTSKQTVKINAPQSNNKSDIESIISSLGF